ncbi:MAG: tetratricopeptide repeat protein [Candidatus Omnitrophica bacterium]|nr:tetratricopeptide repeat protein [Candidatus Omnitrophota bacterium]
MSKSINAKFVSLSIGLLLCATIALAQENAKDYYARGYESSQKRNYAEAIVDFTKAIALDSRYQSAYYARGLAYYYLGKFDQAILDYSKVIEINPKDVKAYHARGLAFDGNSNLEQAILDFTQAIELNPQYDKAYHNRAVVYGKKREFAKAVSDFSKAIQIKPEEDDYYNRGFAYHLWGKIDEAIADYTKALQMAPTDARCLNNRGIIYLRKKEYNNAIADFSEAIALAPIEEHKKHANPYLGRAQAYIATGKYEQAIIDCDNVLQYYPFMDRVHALRTKAEFFLNEGLSMTASGQKMQYAGQLEQVIKQLTEVAQTTSSDARVYVKRGNAYRINQQLDLAIADYTKAIEIDSRYALAYLARAAIYIDREAESDIRSRNENDDPFKNRAIADLTKAIEIDPDYKEAYYYRGIVYYLVGDYAKAIEDVLKAQALGYRVYPEFIKVLKEKSGKTD